MVLINVTGLNVKMSAFDTKQSFIDHNRNDRYRVLSGSSKPQCLLLEVELTLTPAASHGS